MIALYNGESHEIRLSILKGQSDNLEDFGRAKVKILLIGANDKIVLDHEYRDNRLYATLPAHTVPAVYTIQVLWAKNADSLKDLHINSGCYSMAVKQNAFAVTEYPTEATNLASGQILDIKLHAVTYGYDGLNAYELAVLREDTYLAESEWIQVRMGAIQESQIANGAVTERKIADEAVSERTLATSAVTTGKIADSAVTEQKIADKAVTTGKIADSSVTERKVADKAVTTEKIGTGAVTTAKIASSAVTTEKISNNAVTEEKIASYAVTERKIQDGAVSERTLGAGAVSEQKIRPGSITEQKIGAGAVTTEKIAANAVTNAKIADGAVSEQKVAAGAVTTEKIMDGSITTQKVADNAVTAGKIKDGAIENKHIADNAVIAGNIASNAVENRNLADGAVTEDKVAANAVTKDKVADGAITTAKVADGAIGTEQIAEGAINSDKLMSGAITDDKIADGALAQFETEQSQKLSELEAKTDENSLKVDGERIGTGKLANSANIFNDLIPANLSAGTKVRLRLSLGKTASYGITFRGIKANGGGVYKFDGDNYQTLDRDYDFVAAEDLTHVGFYGGARADESNFTMWLKCGVGFLNDEIEKQSVLIHEIDFKNDAKNKEQDTELIKIKGKQVSGTLTSVNDFAKILPINLSSGEKINLRLDADITGAYMFNFRYVNTSGKVVKFEQQEASGGHILNKDYIFELPEDVTHIGFWGNTRTTDTPFVFNFIGNISVLEKSIEERSIVIIDKTSNLIGAGYYKNESTEVGQMFDDTVYNSASSNHFVFDVHKGEKVDITTRFSAPAYGEYVITNNIGRVVKKGVSNGTSVIEEITENGRIYVNVNSNDATMNLLKIVIKSAVNANNAGMQGLDNSLSDKIYHEEDKVIILDSAAANNFTKLFKGDFYKGQVIEISINSDTDINLNQLSFRYIKRGATSSTIIGLTPVLNKKYRIVLPEDADYIGFWSNPASTYVGNAHCILRYGLKADTDHTAEISNGLYKKSKHIRFAMFADSHFANLSGDADNVYDGVNELQRMQLLIDGINKVNKTNPIDFVISCGDTIINTESALQPFVEKVSSKFPAPFISVHGNHDTCSDAVWSQYLRHPKEFSFEFGGFYFILLDTWKGAWNESKGSLTYTEPNMTFLKAELNKAKILGCTPIVALHNVVDRTEFKKFLQNNGCNILLVGHQHFFENVIDANTNKTNAVNTMCAGWFAKRTNNYMVSPIVFNTAWGFDVIELKDGDIIRTHYLVPNNYMDSVPTKEEGGRFVPTGEPPLGVVPESSTEYHVWDECVEGSATPTFNFGAL